MGSQIQTKAEMNVKENARTESSQQEWIRGYEFVDDID